MSEIVNVQSIATALVVAIVFAFVKLFRDVDQIKTAQKYEIEALNKEIKPVVDWYLKTSMDALKIATNPTNPRLYALGQKYAASIMGKGAISAREKQELIDGLMEIFRDTSPHNHKRTSASISLRFIETQEGIELLSRDAK